MRKICEIASDIAREWKKPYFGAVPYLRALTSVSTSEDSYGCDSADQLISYFLANAGQFRGPKAKALKIELSKHLKEPQRSAALKRYQR